MSITMARPKKRRKPAEDQDGESRRRTLASFKGSDPFGAWLDGLIEHVRMPTSTVIEHALICLAKERGYKEEPPPR